MTIIKRIISKILLKNIGKRKFQNIYSGLFNISLLGMNYGAGSDVNDSGEITALEYVREKIKYTSTPLLFDVGANIGEYTLLLEKLFGNSAKIIAIEASEKTYKKLLETTQNLQNIQQINIGIGSKEDTVVLYSDKNDSGLSSIYKRNLDYKNVDMNIQESIQISTIDIICKKHDFTEIHFIKLDIEGNELEAIKGMRHIMQTGKVHFIQFEFGGCNIDSHTYFKDFFYLLKGKYKIYRILKDGLIEIKEYSERLEVFTTTNYLAEII